MCCEASAKRGHGVAQRARVGDVRQLADAADSRPLAQDDLCAACQQRIRLAPAAQRQEQDVGQRVGIDAARGQRGLDVGDQRITAPTAPDDERSVVARAERGGERAEQLRAVAQLLRKAQDRQRARLVELRRRRRCASAPTRSC
jgi:hypothetical protein